MAVSCFEASAPGSLMLMGEYAVLYGHSGIVTAINKRIHVKLRPRQDTGLHIESALGNFTGDISLSKLARDFNIEKSLLAHNYKNYFQCTVHEEINRLRIEYAKQLLKKGYSVTSTAFN